MPEEVDPLSAPSRMEAFSKFVAWQKENGGISLGWQSMRLTLRGRGPQPVIITKIQPRVLTRDRPLDGWFVAPELGGGQQISIVIADLDAPDPVADLLARDERRTVLGLTRSYAFTVSDTDVEHIEVHAFTTAAYVTWGVDIHFEASGKGGTVEVRDARLQITAESSHSRAVYEDSNGRLTATAKWGEGFSEHDAEVYRTMKHV